MATPTQTYVDPSIAADSGAGTIGDPYGDLQYALNTMTRDSTNGDQINIKAGTDEILGSSLSFATYGTPTDSAQLLFRGYTSAANDGGIGGISGNGSVSIVNSTTLDWIHFADMHLHNCGAAAVVVLDDFCTFYNCEIDNTSGNGLTLDRWASVVSCHIHNIGGFGATVDLGSTVAFNYFENGTNDFNAAVEMDNGCFIFFNIIDIDGASDGINETTGTTGGAIIGNSIYSNAGTGSGVKQLNQITPILNNIIEGFSGVGGIGIETNSGDKVLHGANTFYNNTTNESLADISMIDLNLDLTPGASPFADAANDDFTVSTDVKALAFPTANYPSLSVRSYLDMGALQREEPAGGGVGQRPIFRGFTHLG